MVFSSRRETWDAGATLVRSREMMMTMIIILIIVIISLYCPISAHQRA